jgi:hypothetical protein
MRGNIAGRDPVREVGMGVSVVRAERGQAGRDAVGGRRIPLDD